MRRPSSYLRGAAAGVLVAAALVAPASPAQAATGVENFCNPSWPPALTYGLLPSGGQLVTGSITGGDGGPWQVVVESEDGGEPRRRPRAPTARSR